MNELPAKIMLTVLVILAILAVALSFYTASAPVPLTGYVTDKVYHPQYFPVDYNTPWVYAVVIQDEAATRCTTWYVSKSVYDRYEVGQHVTKGLW